MTETRAQAPGFIRGVERAGWSHLSCNTFLRGAPLPALPGTPAHRHPVDALRPHAPGVEHGVGAGEPVSAALGTDAEQRRTVPPTRRGPQRLMARRWVLIGATAGAAGLRPGAEELVGWFAPS